MNSLSHLHLSGDSRQQGAVLALALIFLLLLTIIGVTAMSTATLEEKMAGNTKDRNLAFQAAESALRDGERHARGSIAKASFTAACTNGLCQPALATASTVQQQVWLSGVVNWQTGSNTISYGSITGEPALTGLTIQPRYIIEDIPEPTGGSSSGGGNAGESATCKITNTCKKGLTDLYRITAWGRGPTGAEVLIQTIFER
jgi:type IV pilus assembly protein PilX